MLLLQCSINPYKTTQRVQIKVYSNRWLVQLHSVCMKRSLQRDLFLLLLPKYIFSVTGTGAVLQLFFSTSVIWWFIFPNNSFFCMIPLFMTRDIIFAWHSSVRLLNTISSLTYHICFT